ncbi:MAG: polysaccharide deacetylase family protein [Clostridiaceae bacterium]
MKKYVLIFIASFLFSIFNISTTFSDTEETHKIALLTFDDGPSKTTLEVIKELKELEVPGTFFVIGEKCQENTEEFKSLVSSGNDICVHTYDHDYKMYNSINNYMDDYSKCKKIIEELSGKEVNKFVRFPGGSNNRLVNKSALKEIRSYIVDNGLSYVDWNISSEDALGRVLSVGEITRNVQKEYKQQDAIVILMHDGSKNSTSAKALPGIVNFLKDEGYTFKSLSSLNEAELQLLIDNKLINKHTVQSVNKK